MKHVVVGIISRKNSEGKDEFLLVSSERESFGEHSGAYYPPGGHLEVGEDEKQALVREIKEELNLDVELVKKMAQTPGDVKDQITHWWMCNIVGGVIEPDESELVDVKFATQEEMKELKLWPATRRFFERYIFCTNEF